MKLTVQLGGREAMPVRGIAASTNGGLDIRHVCNMLAEPGYMNGVHTPTVFRIDAKGQIEKLPPALFNALVSRINKPHSRGMSQLAEVLLLPPAVFVWEDEMRKAFEDFHEEVWRQRLQRRLDREPIGMWHTSPLVSNDVRDAVLEGCEELILPIKTVTRRLGKAAGNPRLNEEWQRIAVAKAAEIIATKHVKPSKRHVAKEISKIVNAMPETVERCISKTW